eukprot:gene8432-5910_t
MGTSRAKYLSEVSAHFALLLVCLFVFIFVFFDLFFFVVLSLINSMGDAQAGEGGEGASSPVAIWERINRFYHSSRKSVNILVGNNCDAAAASMTMMSLLKSSLISFSVHPISTYDELRTIVEGIKVAQDFSKKADGSVVDELFILLGVGGPIALEDYFDLTRHVIILMDSHRPIHLRNLQTALRRSSDRLVLWGAAKVRDDADSFFQLALARDNRKRRRQLQRAQARQRRRLHRAVHQDGERSTVSDDSDFSGEDTDDDDDESEMDGDEMSTEGGPVDWLSESSVSASLQKMYESSIGGSKSSALELYDLSILLNKMSDVFLWHAAVGVCDLLRRRCIDYAGYLVEMRPLHDAVALQHGARRTSSAPLTDVSLNAAAPLREAAPSGMRLMNTEDPQLLLLQHVSLWDAMWNDPAVASALGLHHTESGESALKLLLGRCGVSLEMAQRPWYEVPRDSRDDALRLIQDGLKGFAQESLRGLLTNKGVRSVSRAVGFSRDVTTFDVCILFDAILAASPPLATYAMDGSSSVPVSRRLEEFCRAQFWKAHAIIDMDPNHKAFSAAVTNAVYLHRAIGDVTSALMQPGLILSTQGLHYLQLNDSGKTASALETFHTPARLAALAQRLLYTLTAERGLGRFSRAVRPLLVAAPLPRLSKRGAEAPTRDEETTYVVAMASGGQPGAGLRHSKDNAMFNDCVGREDAFDSPPDRSGVNRHCILVNGRENALAEGQKLLWIFIRQIIQIIPCRNATFSPIHTEPSRTESYHGGIFNISFYIPQVLLCALSLSIDYIVLTGPTIEK